MEKDNPFCEHCEEPDCCISFDGTCALIRVYLKAKKPEQNLPIIPQPQLGALNEFNNSTSYKHR